jgi:HD-like signal output (HDOD) protein
MPREILERRVHTTSRRLGTWFGDGGGDYEALLASLRGPEATTVRRPPLAARRLLQESRRSSCSLQKLEAIIDTDPALLQTLLKHANSAFYATAPGVDPIVAAPPALRRLGTKGLQVVVISHLVEGSLCRPGNGLDVMAGAVWDHMVRVGPLARALAEVVEEVDREEAYALGLFHDVGKLVLFNRMADLRRELRRPLRLDSKFVRVALRELHEPLGGLAVMDWGLGEEAARAVAHHHRDPLPNPRCPSSEVVFLAEHLDLSSLRGEEPDLSALHKEGGLEIPLERITAAWEDIRSQRDSAAEEADEEDGGDPEVPAVA